MPDAICPRCGAEKAAAWHPCGPCAHDPGDDETALVECVYYSVGRFDDPVDQERYRSELARMAAAIREGRPPEIPAREFERLREQKRMVDAVTPSRLWTYFVVKLVLPVLLFVGALYAVALLIRWFRR